MHWADFPGRRTTVLVVIFLATMPWTDSWAKTRYRVARFIEKNGMVHMDVTFPNLITRKMRPKLKSGFLQTVLIRAVVREEGTGRMIRFVASTATLVYDLWNETYDLSVVQPGRKLTFHSKTMDDAIKQLTSSHMLPIADYSKLRPNVYYYVDMEVLYNPLSKALLRKVRRWLRTPRDPAADLIAGRSFFGLTLSFFVNPKVSPAERRIRFRTQSFYKAARDKE